MNETMRSTTVSAITIPPRPSHESFFNDMSCFSPGPMSLVSSFLQSPNYYDCSSYSQLLAGAIASSPLAKPTLLSDHSSDEGSEKNMGYKQNRPMSLVLAQSPLFMIPPGLSPSGLLNSPGFLSPLQSPFGMSHQQALAHVTAQAALSQSYGQMQAEDQRSSQVSAEMFGHELSTEPEVSSLQLKVEPLHDRLDNKPSHEQDMKFELPEVSQSDNKSSYSALDKPAYDGYNWRKYGQKKVKASECPRSYYRCTHTKCPVKKKVERSTHGHITEITYSGQHNHELPQPSKQRKDSPALDCSDCSEVKPDTRIRDWTVLNSLDGSSPSRSDQVPNQMASELHVTEECDETKMIAIDEGSDEPNAKRTKTAVQTQAPSQGTVAESKIVLQTRSEVDFLDDGYKWRKYGQKVVKGNQHPRSYYRCTFLGCNVRKQVERASADPKAVITTYEGKHNHDIPTVRNRNSQR